VIKIGTSPGAKINESPSSKLRVWVKISGRALASVRSVSLRRNFMEALYRLKTPVYLLFT
jgi:hypothetical protein